MSRKSFFSFIFVILIAKPLFAQKCLSLQEFQQVKGSKALMKQYVDEVVMSLTSKDIPKQLGQQVKYLAQGSFGKVYQYLSPNQRQIAVKFIQKTQPGTHGPTFDYQALFLEINANSCMVELINMQPEFSSKFVVLKGVYHVTDLDQYLMAMNFYPLDLDKFQKANLNTIYNYASADQVKKIDSIILSLAKALEFMHENNLSHRDLKPANVMMNGPNPMFMDFGLTTPEANNFSTIAGTPYFIDPNLVASGKGGKETDIYALGIMFYVLLNGPASYKNIEVMMNNGNWGKKHVQYQPNTSLLKFPKKYAQLSAMLISDGKPSIQEVIQYIEKAQGKGQLPAVDERHLYGGQNQRPKPKYEQFEKQYEVKPKAQNDLPAKSKGQYVEKYEQQRFNRQRQPVPTKYEYPADFELRQAESKQKQNAHQEYLKEEAYLQLVRQREAEAKKLKAQNPVRGQVQYHNLRARPNPKQEVTPEQIELLRVKNLAAQNKARLQGNNNIFMV